jgi:glucuronoxylan 4-O-methyltransferase
MISHFIRAVKAFIRRVKANPAKLAVALCIWWPSAMSIKAMRMLNEVLLSFRELEAIIRIVKDKAPCNFLVFGLGNDSQLWAKLNHGGKTVFIEDDNLWVKRASEQNYRITAYLVNYGTQLTQWEELLDSPSVFDLNLPRVVTDEQWDVILVDAPVGVCDLSPGRMKSIAWASRLARDFSDVFVHDCDRRVERTYCCRYLKEGNLIAKIGSLRHYRITNHCA